jgi:hypothetical protein
MGRFLEQQATDPDTLAERDARKAIQILADFIRFQAPDWHPSNQGFQE